MTTTVAASYGRTSKEVVSSSFRGLPPIMFRIIADDDQVKDNQATQVIWKGTNFIGFGAKLAEEAFQQVGGTDQRMQGMVKLVKGQAGVHILGQQPHDLGLQRPPRRAKLRQTRFGLRTGGRLKDRVRI